MKTWQQALAQQRNPQLVLFNNFNSLRSSALLEYLKLPVPLEMSPGREAACRAVFGTWGFFRTMHGKTAPSCGLHSQAGVRRGPVNIL